MTDSDISSDMGELKIHKKMININKELIGDLQTLPALPKLSEPEGLKQWIENCTSQSQFREGFRNFFGTNDTIGNVKAVITNEPYLLYHRYCNKGNIFVSVLPTFYDKEVGQTMFVKTSKFDTFQGLTDFLDTLVRKNSRVYLYTLDGVYNKNESGNLFVVYMVRYACTHNGEIDSVKRKFQTLKSRIMELNGHSIIIDKVGTPIYPCEIEKELSDLEAEIEKLYQ